MIMCMDITDVCHSTLLYASRCFALKHITFYKYNSQRRRHKTLPKPLILLHSFFKTFRPMLCLMQTFLHNQLHPEPSSAILEKPLLTL